MKSTRIKLFTLTLIAIGTLVTVSLLRTTQTAKAQDVQPSRPDHYTFGLVGITPGQTLRLNVASTLVANDTNYPPGPTRIAMSLLNSRGQIVRRRDGSPVRKVEMVDRGEATFLELDGDEIPMGAGGRLEVRAVVNVFPPGPTAQLIPYDSAQPSVEIFNNGNSRTVVFIGNPGVIRGFNPQPDPPLGN